MRSIVWQLHLMLWGDEVGADEIEVLRVRWRFRTFDPSCRNGNPCVLWQWSIVLLKGRRFITWRGKANIRTLGCNIWIDICGKVTHMLERYRSLVVSAYLLLAPGRESSNWSANPSKNSQSKLSTLPTQYFSAFRMILGTDINYFPKEH
jgi:hypothetical protein